ncbi:type IIA topoisomerase (DNA gyrase/topo II, topoisomerase IV), A subunit [Desulfocapsa sulfexigens DSM 10523]|uniref:Type IIA topoisomerase (DNA gyrase/topo II, topoisomerase IV), A subunit n=1 Tax=Desulfocapsa sulfexigens (strain DSM 10523 / SB164P1) TaxID=1167006 RepID=M1PCP4_DESSD|nr:DNA topoisomerase IV subunit A [Desulfocapsa sulfexigens]AGF79382.1 type IIA topoisomerase (DNA gyrase/topo II, topoisomerase IV), A subunit [Desulfocapsa sulfexigens DSM 10523]
MESQHGKLRQLFEYNFLEYTSYVIKERAIPDINDGLKPVQRRILQTLHNMDDGRFHKVANVVGATMKLHPHGDQSIFAALVNLANKGYLIDRQGNYGNIFTGDSASAPRYIECRLSPLAREIMFNKDLTEYVDSYDGRMREPVTLPCKIPLLLLQGADGIAVGMATKIMPHNFCELLEAQKKILQGEDVRLYPDFPQGGLVDVSQYNNGNGKIRCRARMEELNEKTIVIREIPFTTTTESLIDSVEKAAKSGKIKIVSISDYTAENVEIEIKLARGIYAKDTIKALYAFTDCEVPISPNLTLVQNGVPRTATVEEVLRYNTAKLLDDLRRELEIDKNRLEDRLHARLLEQIFIEERIYKTIEEKTSYKAVIAGVDEALAPFVSELKRPVVTEDIERLLEIRIKRISRYDINKQKKEIKSIRGDIKTIVKHLKDMVLFTTNYISKILTKYGESYPRLTELTEFTEVSVRRVALSNLTVCYDRKDGFLGHQIKVSSGEPEFSIPCSEYDRLLLIYETGMYKVVQVTDKLFVGHDIRWIGKIQKGLVFNMVYKEGQENLCYVKRFTTPKFILDKEYRLFDEHKQSKILLLSLGEEKSARASLVPSPRAKSNVVEIVFDEYLLKGPSAKGKRVSPRSVRRVIDTTGKTPQPKKINLALPGMENTDPGQGEEE